MQINAHIPLHAARAYGLPRAQPANTAGASNALTSLQRAAQTRDTAVIGSITPATRSTDAPVLRSIVPVAPTPVAEAPRAGAFNETLRSLIAAKVSGSVTFDAAGTTPAAVRSTGDIPSLPLYTRAADRIEAAVAVNLGRTIDLRG